MFSAEGSFCFILSNSYQCKCLSETEEREDVGWEVMDIRIQSSILDSDDTETSIIVMKLEWEVGSVGLLCVSTFKELELRV